MNQKEKKPNIDFMGKRKFAISCSILVILASISSLASQGLNFGVDFTGGVLLEVGYEESANISSIRQSLNISGFDDAQVQNFGSSTDVLIRMLPRPSLETNILADQLLEILRNEDATVLLRRIEFVGPQVGEELTEQGGTAMIFALLMILAYIMFRFQWKFSIGSIAALIHDVIITIGIFSIFQLTFDLSVLAAILAVIGYSLNDTIVVFDRIRENFRQIRRETTEEIMNKSINQILGRTIITSVTTLIVLLSLLFLGGEAVRGFSIALIIGIIVGTYSSIYTASAAVLTLNLQPSDLLMPKKAENVDSLP
ncbi:MAG: protein translocase subunit SecF [Pseudomonadota bacterium]|nr:protein translocase subunit SecF [Pseudomonadota bacterium]